MREPYGFPIENIKPKAKVSSTPQGVQSKYCGITYREANSSKHTANSYFKGTQSFPVIYKEVNSANKRFAIIVDEAHSSQTGDAAKKLKRALADTEDILKEYAEMEAEEEANRKDDEDRLLDELAAQGIQKNLSFFAFTATPKGKTLQMFGTKDAEGIYRPFHIYSMRQAIEEGFILDVLQNYMTYKMY